MIFGILHLQPILMELFIKFEITNRLKNQLKYTLANFVIILDSESMQESHTALKNIDSLIDVEITAAIHGWA